MSFSKALNCELFSATGYLLIIAWSSKYSKQPVPLNTGEFCNLGVVKVGTKAFINLTFKLLLIVAWLDGTSVVHIMLGSFGQGQRGMCYASGKKRKLL